MGTAGKPSSASAGTPLQRWPRSHANVPKLWQSRHASICQGVRTRWDGRPPRLSPVRRQDQGRWRDPSGAIPSPFL